MTITRQDLTSTAGDATPITIAMSGTDMATDQRSQRLARPAVSTSLCVAIANPASGSPVGVIKIMACGSSDTANDLGSVAKAQPVSGAGSWTLDVLNVIEPFVEIFWDVTSGGTGAVFTDTSGQTGHPPTLTWGP